MTGGFSRAQFGMAVKIHRLSDRKGYNNGNLIVRDWKIVLGTVRIGANDYPAQYSFDPSAPPSCSSDYVVMGLFTMSTTGGQANLVWLCGFRNRQCNPTEANHYRWSERNRGG